MNRLVIILIFLPFSIFSQQNVPFQVHKGKIELGGVYLPNEKNDFHSSVILRAAPNPETARPEKMKESMSDYGEGAGIIIPSGKNTPTVFEAFSGNVFDFRVPNDNSIAVSNEGKVVSVINASVSCYDSEGMQIKAYTLDDLASPLSLKELKYDPRVVYDPDADRFIMVYLNGFTDTTSKVVVAFSKSGDPVDGWNLYALPGNFQKGRNKADFPAISITSDHLYITINNFSLDSGESVFEEGVIWKVGKRSGYLGGTLHYQYFNGIKHGGKSFFSIYPVQPGQQIFGPEMYFVTNRGTEAQNDSIFLLKLFTTGMGNDTIVINPLVSSTPYYFPPLAPQPGTKKLETNDARISGAFLKDDCLQFVATTEISTTGKSGIFHGIIWNVDSTHPSLEVNVLNLEDIYCGYPNIASTASAEFPYASMIIFNYSSENRDPGFGGLFYDAVEPYSVMIDLKEGESPVTIQPGTINRWGDYTGIQPHYEKPGVVWAAGSYGKNTTHNTWITRVHMPTIVGVDPPVAGEEIKVFPNPFKEMVKVDFSVDRLQKIRISLVSINGQVIEHFLNGIVKPGNHQFTFSTAPLPSGTYLLNISNEDGELLSTKKLIKP